MKTENPQAFPNDATPREDGMTPRDYFAAKAMQGLLASMTEKAANGRWDMGLDEIAKTSVDLADELLKALKQNQ